MALVLKASRSATDCGLGGARVIARREHRQ
jgi:hypothetical protein